ncbi:hypothetical protein D7X25_27395 [bacterium 1XD42-8]|nr:hypothetical protein D7X25_27395 [bacterium 1XD42-8]
MKLKAVYYRMKNRIANEKIRKGDWDEEEKCIANGYTVNSYSFLLVMFKQHRDRRGICAIRG